MDGSGGGGSRDGRAGSLPVHLTLRTDRGAQVFERTGIALPVFEAVRRSRRTLAALLLPDHLHWLLTDGADLDRFVEAFKAASTRIAWSRGWDGPLWQPSYFEGRLDRASDSRPVARYLLANVLATGRCAGWQDYPWAYLSPALQLEPIDPQPERPERSARRVPVVDRRRAARSAAKRLGEKRSYMLRR